MATVNKNFKIKNGLIVEGATATVNNFDVLTKKQDDQDYIVNLIGGTATSANEANKVVKRDENGDFAAGNITANLSGDVTGNVTGQVSDISNHSTSDLTEGTNLYFTNDRARGAIAAGTGIDYNSSTGYIDANLGTGLGLDGSSQIEIDRTTVDTWYDENGAAEDVQDNLDTHTNAPSAHGVTGNIVGTTDQQDLSNKTLSGTTLINDGATNSGDIVPSGTNITLKAMDDLVLKAKNGDLILDANNGGAYLLSATAGNEIATHSYVDNAVAGLNWKQAVNLLSNVNVSLTGSYDPPMGLTSIDGHSWDATEEGYRVLLTAQSTDSENGIYVASFDTVAKTYALSRTTDSDTYQELIGAAVFVMEGSQYGSTSWVQGDHYLTDFTGQTWTQFSGSGSVTAGTGIIVDGLEISVDTDVIATQIYADDAVSDHSDLTTDVHGVTGDVVGTSNTQTLSNKTIDGPLVLGEGSTSSIYGLTGNIYVLADNHVQIGSVGDVVLSPTGGAYVGIQDPANKIATEGYVNDQDTDDVAEGTTNLYFTDGRAKTSAASLLLAAATTNISITGDDLVGLTITAENGVADSDTDDLVEGETNLYFTDERAVDALEAVVPNFTEVNINTVARQVAARVEVPTASQVTAFEFSLTSSRSAKFLVKSQTATHTELSEILITRDFSGNIAITEYGNIGTNGPLMTITADSDTPVPGIDVTRLRVTTLNNDTVVTVVGTLLA